MQQPGALYLVISICIVIATGVLVYIGIELVRTLRLLQDNLELTEDTLKDVVAAKNGLKSGIVGIAISILNSLQNGGEQLNK